MNSKINATIITALMTIGLCFVLEAEEKKEEANDFSVRFSLGIAPGIDEAENVDVNDDDGSRLEILAVKRFWDANNPTIGWTLGGGIFFSRHSLSDSDFVFDEVDITTFGVMAQGGIVADMGNGFTLELGPYLGAGTANNETTALVMVQGLLFFMESRVAHSFF